MSAGRTPRNLRNKTTFCCVFLLHHELYWLLNMVNRSAVTYIRTIAQHESQILFVVTWRNWSAEVTPRALKLERMTSHAGIFLVFLALTTYHLLVNDEEVLLSLMRESSLGVLLGFGPPHSSCSNVQLWEHFNHEWKWVSLIPWMKTSLMIVSPGPMEEMRGTKSRWRRTYPEYASAILRLGCDNRSCFLRSRSPRAYQLIA